VIRSRSGALVAAFSVSTFASGVTQIAIPLELRQLHATPAETGIALSMFGLGMFLFEWVWGAIADRFGYRLPLIASQVLYAVALFFLARATTVPLVAAAYLLASGMMVAAGPLGRSFLGTTLPPKLRATGLALIAAQWVIVGALGSGAGGFLIDRIPIASILNGISVLPLITAALLALVFRGYRETRRIWGEVEAAEPGPARAGRGFVRVLLITAAIVLLAEIGAGGESALLPLLVTNHLRLSAATAGTSLLLVGLFTGVLLVPGGMASDRWGRRGTMVAGGLLSAAGFGVYAIAGSFAGIVVGAALRAVGMALVWPAATAWISESAPRRRHALVMGLFGEFENFGVALGPIAGGLVWSAFNIQSAFVAYGAASVLMALVALVTVSGLVRRAKIDSREQSDDRQPDRV
jgi:MFS family permease